MRKWEISLLVGVALSLLVTGLTGIAAACDEVREDVIRVHILANSDSEADQALKLQVRDALLAQEERLVCGAQTKEEAQAALQARLPEIREIARQVIEDNGYAYPVTAQAVRMRFPVRTYDSFTLPAGEYDAIRIVIGAGAGHNWWCVLFPPLCIPCASGGQADAKALLGDDAYTLLSAPRYRPAFAVLEWYQAVKTWICG